MKTYRRIVSASRLQGAVIAENFRLETLPVPSVGAGQVLVKSHCLSLDPYMRGRMNDAKSYAQPQPLLDVMLGGTVGEVIESKSGHFKAGDQVVGKGGWQEIALTDVSQPGVLRKVDSTHISLSAYLGAVCMPSGTAWYGQTQITQDVFAFYGEHALHSDYGGIAVGLDEGERIARALVVKKAAILQNHGLLTTGATVDAAAWWFITMERSCQVERLALASSGGKPLQQIKLEAVQQSAKLISTPLAGWFSFQPLYARIVKEQPEFLN